MPLLRAGVFFKNNTTIVKSKVKYISYCCQNLLYPKHVPVVRNDNFSGLLLNSQGIRNSILNRSVTKANSYCCTRLCSTNGDQKSVFNFEKECEETLESLSEHFEEIIEGSKSS